jgi:hypothetical protein
MQAAGSRKPFSLGQQQGHGRHVFFQGSAQDGQHVLQGLGIT